MNTLCPKGEMLDDYAAKRYSDYWNARRTRQHVAHHAKFKDEAYTALMNHINGCEHCKAHVTSLGALEAVV